MTIMLPVPRSSKRAVKRLGPADILLASVHKDSGALERIHWKFIIAMYSRDIHPANEDLEEFHFGRASAHQRQNIESHLHHCDSCRGLLEDLREFIVALSSAIR
jgi:hypothetical protein